MAKLIAPHQIGGIMELMELVTDPTKGQAYLDELRAYQSAINERLDMLNTKEEADEYLNAAKQKLSDADLLSASLKKREDEFNATRARWRDNLAKAKDLLGV